ncbi:MAG: glycosyltransferase family 4 protein [Bacteroidetes bacterium]|nr:glycosyltransferase family 4 protein [Bacteroidota bacterium]
MTKRKFLFNCSTNIVGGGLKNSAFFIKQAMNSDKIEWNFAVSKEVKNLLEAWGIQTNDSFHVFESTPARDKSARKKLSDLVKKISPELVFTMAGPAYVKFSSLHVQGLSNPYVTHADWEGFMLRGSFSKAVSFLLQTIVQLWCSRWADYFVFQTDEARNQYCKRAFINRKRTTVISNAYDLNMKSQLESLEEKQNGKIRIICPAPSHSHKGLQFIPAIAYELKKILNKPFEFVLTIDKDSMWNNIVGNSKRYNVEENVVTRGSFNYSEVVGIYKDTDLVFVPSLVETFSATYLEAMAAKKPLLVADKGFARSICGDSAVYLNPKEPVSAAKKINEVLNNEALKRVLLKNGITTLQKYGDHKERFSKIENYLLSIKS